MKLLIQALELLIKHVFNFLLFLDLGSERKNQIKKTKIVWLSVCDTMLLQPFAEDAP